MRDNCASASYTVMHNAPPPSSHTVSVDETPSQSVSKNHVSGSKAKGNDTLHSLDDPLPVVNSPYTADHIVKEEILPLTRVTSNGVGTGNKQYYNNSSSPSIDEASTCQQSNVPQNIEFEYDASKMTLNSYGPPPPYNPRYMPFEKNVTTPKTTSHVTTKTTSPNLNSRNLIRSNTNGGNSAGNRSRISPYWLLIPMIFFACLFIIMATSRNGISTLSINELEVERKMLLEQWRQGREFSLGDKEDRRALSILVGHPNEDADPVEILQWVLTQKL